MSQKSESVVVMGPSGAGKTSVGQALARRLGHAFLDADDLHSLANRAKMAAGEALTDADRVPWLGALADRLAQAHAAGAPLVLACSALKRAYREELSRAAPVRWVYLAVPAPVLRSRLASRQGHFFPPSLLASQLASLEPPGDEALVIDATQPLDHVVDTLLTKLHVGS